MTVDFDGHTVIVLPDDLTKLAGESSVIVGLLLNLDLISDREEAHHDPSSM